MVGRCWGWRYLSAEQSWPAFAHRLASNRLEFPGGSEGGQARSRSRRVDGSVGARDFDERQKLVSVLEQLTLGGGLCVPRGAVQLHTAIGQGFGESDQVGSRFTFGRLVRSEHRRTIDGELNVAATPSVNSRSLSAAISWRDSSCSSSNRPRRGFSSAVRHNQEASAVRACARRLADGQIRIEAIYSRMSPELERWSSQSRTVGQDLGAGLCSGCFVAAPSAKQKIPHNPTL